MSLLGIPEKVQRTKTIDLSVFGRGVPRPQQITFVTRFFVASATQTPPGNGTI
jgi:hypothetical protein